MANPSRKDDDRGFVMVAVLVGMAIAAIWMSAALPSWRQQVQRQREDDLIFRGEQYARAIVLFQNKNRGANPQDIDILVNQHFLRKKWKDPITNKDFSLVGPGIISQAAAPTPGASGFGTNTPAAGSGQINTGGSQTPGITGVRSTSTATSIKVYQQQQQYSLWQFDAATYRNAHGMASANPQQNQQNGGRQGGAPGDRGGRDGGPGAAGPGRPGTGAGGPGRGTGPGGAGPASPPPVSTGRGRGGY